MAHGAGRWDDLGMANSVNHVFLLGHIGQQPRYRDAGGTRVAHVRLATNRPAKGADGEWGEATDWHDVTVWDAAALRPLLRKGTRLHVRGRLRTRSWDKDGETRRSTEVACRARDVIVLTPKDRAREAA